MTFSGHLEEKIGVRFTVALGCSIMVLGVLLTSVAVQLSVVLTAITYGCCFGLGLALAYAPPLGVAMKWFPKSKGLVNGIIGNIKYFITLNIRINLLAPKIISYYLRRI